MHLSARLRELEAEADTIRTELAEMDNLATVTEAAIYRLLSSVFGGANSSSEFNSGFSSGFPSDAELEAAMRQSSVQPRMQTATEFGHQPNAAGTGRQQPTAPFEARRQPSPPAEVRREAAPQADGRRQPIPIVRSNVEANSDRFTDRTIPQCVTMLLREEGGPLHVNEIYNRLQEGGFNFTGANPTISIAVSLNRNTRFRKISPGTFDLMIRDASKAS
jgi:hypothetical protein